jgi:hypothetical protein
MHLFNTWAKLPVQPQPTQALGFIGHRNILKYFLGFFKLLSLSAFIPPINGVGFLAKTDNSL